MANNIIIKYFSCHFLNDTSTFYLFLKKPRQKKKGIKLNTNRNNEEQWTQSKHQTQIHHNHPAPSTKPNCPDSSTLREREFGSDRWCVVAELVNSDHGAIVEREKLRLERDSVHRGWRERERDRDRESVEIILKSNDWWG